MSKIRELIDDVNDSDFSPCTDAALVELEAYEKVAECLWDCVRTQNSSPTFADRQCAANRGRMALEDLGRLLGPTLSTPK